MEPQKPVNLADLLSQIRSRAEECRGMEGTPCQSEYRWHAEEFEHWAAMLEAYMEQPVHVRVIIDTDNLVQRVITQMQDQLEAANRRV